MGKKNELDKFYTKSDVSKRCVDYLDSISPLSSYNTIIEPSAGNGSFLPFLPVGKTHAYDIMPEADRIIEKDFLAVAANDINGRPLLFIGNPPFGIRSSIAKRFISHAIELGADTIAFILPETFSKMNNQRMFPAEWRLVSIIDLERDSFTLDGEDYHVPCSFFIWTKQDSLLPGTDLRKTKPPQPSQYSYLGRGDMRADFSINGNSGRVRSLPEITNPKAEHYIKVADGYDVQDIRTKMGKLDLDFRSSANGGVAWVNRDDINRAFGEKYGLS